MLNCHLGMMKKIKLCIALIPTSQYYYAEFCMGAQACSSGRIMNSKSPLAHETLSFGLTKEDTPIKN